MARRRRRATRGCLGAPGGEPPVVFRTGRSRRVRRVDAPGVFVAELVPEEDIRSTPDACGGGAPATAATDDALATCDVVEAEMFAEQRLPGAPAPALYVRARGTYTALVRGPGAETSKHHKRLVERGLRVFAASLDRVEDETNGDGEDHARVSLVPGCAAFEAAMCARLRDAVDDARWRRRDARTRNHRSDDEGVDREARVMALGGGDARDVSRGARAVGAEHGGARENAPARGRGRGQGAGTVRRWSDGNSVSDATRTFDRTNAKLPREALDLLSRASESVRAGGSTLVGRVSAASAPEATHPGTAAAIFNSPPPPHAFGEGETPRVAFFARALDPAQHAALEPSSAAIGKILAALEAVETAIRIGETLPAAVRIGTRRSVVGARGRRVGGDRRRRCGGSARRRKIVGRVGRRVEHERRRRRVGRRRGGLSVVGGKSRRRRGD